MSLRTVVAEKVTHELLSNVLSLLSSVSSSLSKDDIKSVVTCAIESCQQKLNYKTNNDLGICIDRLLTSLQLAEAVDLSALESHYPSIRKNDDIVTDIIQQTAHGIASQLTTPIYDLRKLIPQEAKDLSAKIMKNIPSDDPTIQPTPRRFDWGRLGTDIGRTTTVLFARDRTPCLKGDVPHYYDTENILSSLPYGDVKPVGSPDVIKDGLIKELTQIVASREDISPEDRLRISASIPKAVETITSQKSYRSWITGSRQLLSGKNIARAVVETTDTIDAVENILHLISVSTLNKIGSDVSVAAENILFNIDTVLSNIQLLRAAMLYPKEVTLAGRILFSPSIVQKQALESFVVEGGTESMVNDYISYIKLNEHVVIPGNGVSADTIRSVNDRARKEVTEKQARLKDVAIATRASAIQSSLAYHLDRHNEIMVQENKYNAPRRQHEHVNKKQAALVSLNSRSLEDIALEYLVGMRDSYVTRTLYKTIKTELHGLVKRESAITDKAVSQATCSAIAAYVLDKLVTRFSIKVAV